MALPSGTTISVSQINSELGASATRQIWLSHSDLRTLAQVPSGQISMSNFWGKSNAPVAPPTSYTLNGGQLSQNGGNPNTTATARFNVNADGTWSSTGSNNGAKSGRWQSGSDGANYDLLWSDGGPDGAQLWNFSPNTWTTINQQLYVAVQAGSEGVSDTIYFSVRQKANTGNVENWSVTLTAQGACFAKGTMLRTPFGDRAVETLLVNEFVSSFSEPTMLDESIENWREWTVNTLDNVKTTEVAEIYSTRHFEESTSIKINGMHSTLSHIHFVFDGDKFGWKAAKDILKTDMFVDSDLNLVTIESIEQVSTPTTFVAVNVEQLDTLQVKVGDKYLLTHNVSA